MNIINLDNQEYKLVKHHISDRFVNSKHIEKWETDTFYFLKRYSDPEKIAIDLGSWIGIFTIFLARLNKKVISIDGDPVSISITQKNCELNNLHNVEFVNKPITKDGRIVTFGSNQLCKTQVEWNHSTSQVYRENKPFPKKTDTPFDEPIKVKSLAFKELIKNYKPEEISIIKVDIESGEEELIEDMLLWANHKCKIFMSFHIFNKSCNCDWWSNTNLERFRQLFSTYQFIHHSIGEVEPISYLRKCPLASLLII